MSARELPPLPWRPSDYGQGRLYVVVDKSGWPIARTESAELAAALCRPDVAALLRGEAVAVPREPTLEMLDAAGIDNDDIEPGDIYRAMLAASPFAKEGK